MKIVKSYKTEVIYPGSLPLMKDDQGVKKPYCKEHREFYHKCNCPKPYSTPETDGWQVTKEGKILYASPTEQLYEGAALWIEVSGDIIKCNRCEKQLDINDFNDASKMLENLSYLEFVETAVDSFFDIHAECAEVIATEKHQSASGVKS